MKREMRTMRVDEYRRGRSAGVTLVDSRRRPMRMR
jgi:hypothetical protein